MRLTGNTFLYHRWRFRDRPRFGRGAASAQESGDYCRPPQDRLAEVAKANPGMAWVELNEARPSGGLSRTIDYLGAVRILLLNICCFFTSSQNRWRR
jgi:hypothetical protein